MRGAGMLGRNCLSDSTTQAFDNESLPRNPDTGWFVGPDPLKAQESIGGEPLLGALRWKRIKNVFCLSIAGKAVQCDETIWCSQISIVLGNLIFQDQVVSKGVPGQFINHAMILMEIVPIVRQDQVWIELLLEFFEFPFDSRMKRRKETVPKFLDRHFFFLCLGKENVSRPKRFSLPDWSRAENIPVDHRPGMLAKQTQNGSAAPDFNVITVRTQAEDPAKRLPAGTETNLNHHGGSIRSRKGLRQEHSQHPGPGRKFVKNWISRQPTAHRLARTDRPTAVCP